MTWVPMVICCYIFMFNMVRHDFQLFFYNIYELHVYDIGSNSDMLLPAFCPLFQINQKNARVNMRNSVSTKLSFLFQFESLTSHNAIHSLPVHSPLPRSLPSPSLALCCAISLPHSPPLSISLTLPIQSPSPSSISHHCCRQTLIVPATIDYRYVALL